MALAGHFKACVVVVSFEYLLGSGRMMAHCSQGGQELYGERGGGLRHLCILRPLTELQGELIIDKTVFNRTIFSSAGPELSY